jgi:hypothetical protein
MGSIEQTLNFYQSGTTGTTSGDMVVQIEPDGNLLNSHIGIGENHPITGTYDQVTHAVNFHTTGPAAVLHGTSYSGYAFFDSYGNLSALAGEYHRNGSVVNPAGADQGGWYATAVTFS